MSTPARLTFVAPQTADVAQSASRLFSPGALHSLHYAAIAGAGRQQSTSSPGCPAGCFRCRSCGRRRANRFVAALVMDGCPSQKLSSASSVSRNSRNLRIAQTEELQDEGPRHGGSPRHSRSVSRQIAGAGVSGNQSRSSAVGSTADAFDVLHHGKSQRIGVDPRKAVDRRSPAGKRHCMTWRISSIAPSLIFALVEEAVHDGVVDESGATLVHDLRLSLRIEVLRDHANDSQYLPLPGLKDEAGLLQEIEQVLFREVQRFFARELRSNCVGSLFSPAGESVLHRSLKVCSFIFQPLAHPLLLFFRSTGAGAVCSGTRPAP